MDQLKQRRKELNDELSNLNKWYTYIYNLPNRDVFEESVLTYIKKQMRSLNGSLTAIEKQINKGKNY